VVSSADLGGLGAREGTPVACTWEPPPPAPPELTVATTASIKLLFWLLILLVLFLFRPNRSPKAWWIGVPVLVSALLATALVCLLADKDGTFEAAGCSFVVGLAAVWLFMPYLVSRSGVVAFFKTLPVLAGFSLLAFVPTLLGPREGWLDFRPQLTALLAMTSLAATLALVFTGLSVRRRFGRVRCVVWLAVWTVLAWTVIATPFAVFGSLNGGMDWGAGLVTILYASAISLGLVLPLALLSFFQPFYRDRFFGWLNLPRAGPPVGAG
jgi:hypothetical protein